MFIKYVNVVVGLSGFVVWFIDFFDSFFDLCDGNDCIYINVNGSLEDGVKKVVIVKEGVGDVVVLLGENRSMLFIILYCIIGFFYNIDNLVILFMIYLIVCMKGGM